MCGDGIDIYKAIGNHLVRKMVLIYPKYIYIFQQGTIVWKWTVLELWGKFKKNKKGKKTRIPPKKMFFGDEPYLIRSGVKFYITYVSANKICM